MKNIPVRIGWELLVFIFGVMFFCSLSALSEGKWQAIVLSGIIFIVIILMMFSIKYAIDDEFFYVKNSVFGLTKIKISDIYKIEKTWNAVSSPAPSIFGRVEIYYNNQSIVISPKNYEDLKRNLLNINPNITIKQ